MPRGIARSGHCRGVGGALPLANDFLFATAGNGWHLDRNAFDRMLATEAERARGQAVAPHALGGGPLCRALRGRCDRHGPARAAARRALGRRRPAGRITRFFASDPSADPRTLVEAFADGWWYTAGLPDGGCVVACLTDAPLARRLRLADAGESRCR